MIDMILGYTLIGDFWAYSATWLAQCLRGRGRRRSAVSVPFLPFVNVFLSNRLPFSTPSIFIADFSFRISAAPYIAGKVHRYLCLKFEFNLSNLAMNCHDNIVEFFLFQVFVSICVINPEDTDNPPYARN